MGNFPISVELFKTSANDFKYRLNLKFKLLLENKKYISNKNSSTLNRCNVNIFG